MRTSVVRSAGSADRSVERSRRSRPRSRQRPRAGRQRLRRPRAGHHRHRLGHDHARPPAGAAPAPRLTTPAARPARAGMSNRLNPMPRPARSSGPARGTVRARRPRTSRRTAPASRRVDGGSRTARTRPRRDRVHWGRRCVDSIDGVPFSLRLPRAGRWRDVVGNTKLGPTGRTRLSARRDTVPDVLRPALSFILAGRWVDYRRPRPERREGGLSTTSSTNLST